VRKPIFLAFLAGVLVTGTTLAAAPATQPIPVADLASLPQLQSVSMTPDGKYLVGLIPSPKDPHDTALATWDVDALGAGPKVVTPSGDREHMQFFAAFALKAGKVLVDARQQWTGQVTGCGIEGNALGATRTFVTKTYLTDVDQKQFVDAFASKKHSLSAGETLSTCLKLINTASLVDMLPLDPDNVIISRLSGVTLMTSYYRYNLKTGEAELLFQGGSNTAPDVFDSRTGKLLVKSKIESSGNDDYKQETLILDPKTGKFVSQPALQTMLSDRHTVQVVGVDESTSKYYVLTDQFSDQVQAYMYDATSGKYDSQPLIAAKDYSITGIVFGKQPVNFGKVVGYTVGGPYSETTYVAPHLAGIQAAIEKAFPGQLVSITDYNNDFSKVLFTTVSANEPTAYHLLINNKLETLGSTYPLIKPSMTGEEKWVTYAARDGLQIPAILNLPPGWTKADGPLPTVIMPHGGPWARDFMYTEDWFAGGWVPLLTSRGYAVLRPQYRGSEGLGRKLWLAGDAQWGLKMSDDLDDGAAWLVQQGIAAKNRIAIFGYSYGGFAAVAATVRSPSPFQCAIAGAPVADLGRLGTSWSDNRLQRILQGHTVKGMNPVSNADKAHLPILIFDGDRDVRTPRAVHAIPFSKAVEGKVHSKYVQIPDMPHSVPWYPSQKQEADDLIVNWLANDCGGVSHP
jgi:dipeptidyl aminopeptidase/acylaminoacyl peptidase